TGGASLGLGIDREHVCVAHHGFWDLRRMVFHFILLIILIIVGMLCLAVLPIDRAAVATYECCPKHGVLARLLRKIVKEIQLGKKIIPATFFTRHGRKAIVGILRGAYTHKGGYLKDRFGRSIFFGIVFVKLGIRVD